MLPIHWAGKERGDGLAAVTPLTTHTEAPTERGGHWGCRYCGWRIREGQAGVRI